jgi:hypothetical protein
MIIEQSQADLTSHAGLGLIGMALNERTDLGVQAKAAAPARSDAMPHADILKSYVALLSLGKSDFQAIDAMREDDYFAESLGVPRVPSQSTLRQRMDVHAASFLPVVQEAAIEFLPQVNAPITPLPMGMVPLDADVTPLDNSGTQKEGVSFTYKGMDGFAPMAGYLGQEGYCLELELREGKQHCQKDTPEFLRRNLVRARRLTDKPILLRLDGGNDAIENVDVVFEHNERHPNDLPVHYLIKWNPRQQDHQHWLDYAEQHGEWTEPRPGKRVALFTVDETRTHNGYEYPLRRVMRVTERSIDKHGQPLLLEEIEIEGWWTSLRREEQEIIDLYADHGTSEQFHSEFKTDLDLERLPSGKFATNALVLGCAQLAFNVLRWIGQHGLLGADAPLRHKAKRRRIRTVLQELMYVAARLIRTGRRLKLAFGRSCSVVPIFRRLYLQLA